MRATDQRESGGRVRMSLAIELALSVILRRNHQKGSHNDER
jgi:hypothetical protein